MTTIKDIPTRSEANRLKDEYKKTTDSKAFSKLEVRDMGNGKYALTNES